VREYAFWIEATNGSEAEKGPLLDFSAQIMTVLQVL
jgi:hypothetical protein